ncbi:kinase-like domain-containing protein [Gongronella butleri]|nr:kinase-like domain-containing protein [Gongronella butleri]
MQDPVRAAARQRQPRPPLLLAATTNLSKTFERRDPNYSYHPDNNPKRILTQPSKPAKNDGYDNENSDYILFVNDILGEGTASYRVIDLLGQGTYGQVVKCEHLASKELYSVKVIKNRANFRRESHMEANILKKLNEHAHSDRHILRLETTFTHKNHFCLVFELLSVNLFELIRQTGFKGLPLSLVRNISRQLLDALDFLFEARVIHCDLKPENILLQNVASPKIKVIDFGSACYKTNPKYTYIQSRFYRSPEVILKLFYSHGIDMWSLGCITAELFTGVPLFPGSSEFDQLSRIMDMLGEPPTDVLDYGKDTSYYFDTETQHGRTIYKRKSREKYNKDNNKRERAHTNHHKHSNLKDIIMSHGRANNEPLPAFGNDGSASQKDECKRQLVDFLLQCLDLHSLKRWQPATALKHPFITGSLATDAQGVSSMRQQRSQSLYQPNTNTRLPAAVAAEPRRRATLNYPAKPLG